MPGVTLGGAGKNLCLMFNTLSRRLDFAFGHYRIMNSDSKKTIILVFAIIFSLQGVQGAAMELSGQDRELLLHADTFKIVHQFKNIPTSVQTEFLKLTHEREIADPNQPFRMTDGGSFSPRKTIPPFHRLIFAGVSSDHCVVVYEKGGIAYVSNVVLFRIDKNRAKLIWGGRLKSRVDNLEALKKSIEHNQISDPGEYW